ncbi:hypothetical protein AOLI_G00052780 [Acnodon oligacanthus]
MLWGRGGLSCGTGQQKERASYQSCLGAGGAARQQEQRSVRIAALLSRAQGNKRHKRTRARTRQTERRGLLLCAAAKRVTAAAHRNGARGVQSESRDTSRPRGAAPRPDLLHAANFYTDAPDRSRRRKHDFLSIPTFRQSSPKPAGPPAQQQPVTPVRHSFSPDGHHRRPSARAQVHTTCEQLFFLLVVENLQIWIPAEAKRLTAEVQRRCSALSEGTTLD